jgi:hypothetical protein
MFSTKTIKQAIRTAWKKEWNWDYLVNHFNWTKERISQQQVNMSTDTAATMQ